MGRTGTAGALNPRRDDSETYFLAVRPAERHPRVLLDEQDGKIRQPSGDWAKPRRTMRSVESVSRSWPLKVTVPRFALVGADRKLGLRRGSGVGPRPL